MKMGLQLRCIGLRGSQSRLVISSRGDFEAA